MHANMSLTKLQQKLKQKEKERKKARKERKKAAKANENADALQAKRDAEEAKAKAQEEAAKKKKAENADTVPPMPPQCRRFRHTMPPSHLTAFSTLCKAPKVAVKKKPTDKRHIKATYANSTPVTDGQRVVAFFGSEGLFAYTVKGEFLWKKNLGRLDVGEGQARQILKVS